MNPLQNLDTSEDMQRKSKTPRTDAEAYVWQNGGENPFVHRDFARQLERELAEANAEVKRLKNILENTRESRDTMIEDRNLLDQELTSLKAEPEVERLHAFIKKCLDLLDCDLPTMSTARLFDEYESQYGKLK